MFNLGLAIAFFVMLSFAASDLLAKRVSSQIGSKRTTFIMFCFSFVTFGLIALFVGGVNVNVFAALIAVGSGAIYSVAYLLLYKSLEKQQVSNSISLVGIEYILIAIFSITVLGESLATITLVAFVGVFIGAFLVTTKENFRFNRGYLPAALSMCLFGVNFMFLVFAEQASGNLLFPLLVNRAIAIPLLGMYLKFYPEKTKSFSRRSFRNIGLKTLVINAFTGVFNATGSFSLLFLASFGVLALGSTIAAVEPALVVLAGYLIYKERFKKHQIFGFIILIISTIVLSAV